MPDCRKIRPTGLYPGKQGFTYNEGISKESSGSQAHLHAPAHHPARRPRQGAQARDA